MKSRKPIARITLTSVHHQDGCDDVPAGTVGDVMVKKNGEMLVRFSKKAFPCSTYVWKDGSLRILREDAGHQVSPLPQD